MVSGWKFLPFCTPTETPFRLFLINWRIWLANPVLTIFPTHLPRQYQGKVWVTAKGSNFFFFQLCFNNNHISVKYKNTCYHSLIRHIHLMINLKFQYCFQNQKTLLKSRNDLWTFAAWKGHFSVNNETWIWRFILLLSSLFCLICYLGLVHTFPQTQGDELSYCPTVNSY